MADLPHLAARLFGAPLLLARPKLEAVLAALGPRLLGQGELAPLAPQRDAPGVVVTPEGVAVVPVLGTLVARSGYLEAASGLTSYRAVGEALAAAAGDPQVRAVLLEIDSAGGEVGGLFDLADGIAALRSTSGKPVWAIASESALSAAYAVACACDRIWATQTAEVGSIGVVAVHVDESGADAKAGLAWSFVHAGARKLDGNPHAPLSDQARAAVQQDVDDIHERFVALVARNRGLAPEAVRATEAAIYRGAAALGAGLVDAIGPPGAALAALAAQLRRPQGLRTQSRPQEIAMTQQETLLEAAAEAAGRPEAPVLLEASTAPAPAAHESVRAAPPPDATLLEARLRSEYAELTAIAAQAARLGVTLDAGEAIAKGLRPDALRRAVLEELAARSDALDLVAAAAPTSSAPAESPIVRRARERAQAS